VATGQTIAFLKDKIDISVYFKSTAPEDAILNLKSILEGMPEVKLVDYVSSDKALENFKTEHSNDPTIVQSLNQLSTNPFEATLNIKANDPSQYGTIDQYLKADALSQYVDKVDYAQNQVVISRLTSIINGVNRAGLILTIILTLIAGLVVFNTVRLAIYSNRDEIGVMRLVGASNIFVRGPYIVEGIIGGFFSAVISTIFITLLIAAIPLVFPGSSYVDVALPGFSFSGYVYSNIFNLFLYQLLFGIFISTASSFIAVRKYLRS
jgi:cell division transport system permease protein